MLGFFLKQGVLSCWLLRCAGLRNGLLRWLIVGVLLGGIDLPSPQALAQHGFMLQCGEELLAGFLTIPASSPKNQTCFTI